MGEDVIYGPHLCGYGLIRAARQDGRRFLPATAVSNRNNRRI